MKTKSIYLTLIALLAIAAASCSNNKKEITPSSTEFTSGDIGRVLQIVEEPCEMTFSKKDGAISSQVIRLTITLKNVDGSGHGIDPKMINFTSLLSVAVVNVTDENGATLFSLDLADSDKLKLKQLLVGEKDATSKIVFEGTFHNADDTPKWFKSAKYFTPTLSADISLDDSMSTFSSESSSLSSDDSSDDLSSETTDSFSSESGSEDWDELLDSYEEYVDEYISYVKKAAKGDMSALAEYTSLMEKAQEYSDKLSGAKGDLSAAQWSRYMKITKKLSTAAM